MHNSRYPSLRGHARSCMLILLGLDFADAPAPEAICFGCTVSEILEQLTVSSRWAARVGRILTELTDIIRRSSGQDSEFDILVSGTVEQHREWLWRLLDDLIEDAGLSGEFPPDI